MYETWVGYRSCVLSQVTERNYENLTTNLHCAPALFYTFCYAQLQTHLLHPCLNKSPSSESSFDLGPTIFGFAFPGSSVAADQLRSDFFQVVIQRLDLFAVAARNSLSFRSTQRLILNVPPLEFHVKNTTLTGGSMVSEISP